MLVAVVAVVAVKKWVLKWAKNNSIFIYKYRSKFWGVGKPLENCNTAATAIEQNDARIFSGRPKKIEKKLGKNS